MKITTNCTDSFSFSLLSFKWESYFVSKSRIHSTDCTRTCHLSVPIIDRLQQVIIGTKSQLIFTVVSSGNDIIRDHSIDCAAVYIHNNVNNSDLFHDMIYAYVGRVWLSGSITGLNHTVPSWLSMHHFRIFDMSSKRQNLSQNNGKPPHNISTTTPRGVRYKRAPPPPCTTIVSPVT